MKKLLMYLNIAYSYIWIKATGKSKHEYRELSTIHNLIIKAISE